MFTYVYVHSIKQKGVRWKEEQVNCKTTNQEKPQLVEQEIFLKKYAFPDNLSNVFAVSNVVKQFRKMAKHKNTLTCKYTRTRASAKLHHWGKTA